MRFNADNIDLCLITWAGQGEPSYTQSLFPSQRIKGYSATNHRRGLTQPLLWCYEALAAMDAGGSETMPGGARTPIHCAVCNQFLNGPLRYEEHLVSKKHLRNVAKATVGVSHEELAGDSASPTPDVPEGHVLIPCLAMSGRQVGHVTLPRSALWGQIAAEVVLRYPDYRPVPPANARGCTAGEIEAINIVTGP